jgi:hypothetical protein
MNEIEIPKYFRDLLQQVLKDAITMTVAIWIVLLLLYIIFTYLEWREIKCKTY